MRSFVARRGVSLRGPRLLRDWCLMWWLVGLSAVSVFVSGVLCAGPLTCGVGRCQRVIRQVVPVRDDSGSYLPMRVCKRHSTGTWRTL